MEAGNSSVSDESKDAFSYINERPVDDISLEFFYKPHTITLLAVSIAAVIYTAFVRYANSTHILCLIMQVVFNVPYALASDKLLSLGVCLCGSPHCALREHGKLLVIVVIIEDRNILVEGVTEDESRIQDNIWSGICCVVFFFLIVSVLTFPNGPFTRPHPAVWRIVFGMSVLYLLALLFLLFQSYSTVYEIMYWIDPNLRNFHIDMDKEYAVNCSDLSPSRIWSHVDVFAWGHFLGWMFKAILFRHTGLLWAISVMWEITEIAFAHLLPNFLECWWDSIILDVLICNGLGIWCGLKICKALEMREYKWVSIRDISSTTGKIKRAILQFTPVYWTPVRWLDPTCTYMRFFALSQLVVFWQISELNTFFLKHIFEMPPSHPLVIARLCLIGVIVAPSVRQYYTYVTDPRCKRVGTQCWVYGAIMVTESMLCIKNGKELFGQAQMCNVVVWLVIQILVSIGCVYGVVLYHQYFEPNREAAIDSPKKEK